MTQEKMLEMFELQNQLNIQTNGENWILGITNQGREINWHRCIFLEVAEAVESTNWKHWKDIDKKDDIENIKIELVDIWHFLMSQMIVVLKTPQRASLVAYSYLISFENMVFPSSLIESLESIAKISIYEGLPIGEFIRTVNILDDFSFNDVYSLYIGKNCLNQFRQDNGYKDGSYKKIWNGKEDNVYMQKYLQNNPNSRYQDLYKYLNDVYSTVKEEEPNRGGRLVRNGMREILDV